MLASSLLGKPYARITPPLNVTGDFSVYHGLDVSAVCLHWWLRTLLTLSILTHCHKLGGMRFQCKSWCQLVAIAHLLFLSAGALDWPCLLISCQILTPSTLCIRHLRSVVFYYYFFKWLFISFSTMPLLTRWYWCDSIGFSSSRRLSVTRTQLDFNGVPFPFGGEGIDCHHNAFITRIDYRLSVKGLPLN